jgi:hypothetical protein
MNDQLTQERFARIDPIRSVTQMRMELVLLPQEPRRDVILYALGHSRFQWTWSYFAKRFEVPESMWPPVPK